MAQSPAHDPYGAVRFDLVRLAAANLVAQIDYHDSLGSTNDRALELAAQGEAALPLLVVCERQTAGRGRGASRWLSLGGSLTFSLVLEAPAEQLPPQRRSPIALVVGLAVCEALEALAPAADFQLKWPNDVYLRGRKLCGILCESVPGAPERLVVGVGVNVNNSSTSSELAGTDLAHFAIALIDHDGLSRDLTSVLLGILDRFDSRWRGVLEDGFEPLAPSYRQRCLLAQKTVTIAQAGGQAVIGLCRSIDDEGALRLQTDAAEVRVFSGTVAKWE